MREIANREALAKPHLSLLLKYFQETLSRNFYNLINKFIKFFLNIIRMSSTTIDKCFFSYLTNAIFLIGITVFIYYLILDYRDQVKPPNPLINDETNKPIEPRPKYKTIWIFSFLIMLLSGFFISSYMCQNSF